MGVKIAMFDNGILRNFIIKVETNSRTSQLQRYKKVEAFMTIDYYDESYLRV